jgi:hypothetical protein
MILADQLKPATVHSSMSTRCRRSGCCKRATMSWHCAMYFRHALLAYSRCPSPARAVRLKLYAKCYLQGQSYRCIVMLQGTDSGVIARGAVHSWARTLIGIAAARAAQRRICAAVHHLVLSLRGLYKPVPQTPLTYALARVHWKLLPAIVDS